MKVTLDTSCDNQKVRKVKRDMYIENEKNKIKIHKLLKSR